MSRHQKGGEVAAGLGSVLQALCRLLPRQAAVLHHGRASPAGPGSPAPPAPGAGPGRTSSAPLSPAGPGPPPGGSPRRDDVDRQVHLRQAPAQPGRGGAEAGDPRDPDTAAALLLQQLGHIGAAGEERHVPQHRHGHIRPPVSRARTASAARRWAWRRFSSSRDMAKSIKCISLSVRSAPARAISRARSPPAGVRGTARTGQSSSTRTAFRVISSGSPGPTPTA